MTVIWNRSLGFQTLSVLVAFSLPALGLSATFELQHGALPDPSYVYEHALIRSDTFLADTPQGNSDLLVGTKADTGSGDQGELRSLLEFNLSSIVAGIGSATITSVTLELQHLPTTGGLARIDGSPKVDVYGYDFDVSRDAATWNDPDGDGNPGSGDTTPGGTLGAFVNTFGELSAADGILLRTLESTPAFITAVQNALAGDQNLRLILVEDMPDVIDRDIAFFHGTDTKSPAVLPRITITTEDSATLFGDYNDDGIVDSADYVVWRKNLDAIVSLPNEDPDMTPGQVTDGDYSVWTAHFGEGVSLGASSTSMMAANTPEPGMLLLFISASASIACFSRGGARGCSPRKLC